MFPENVRWLIIAAATALGALAIPERPVQAVLVLCGTVLLAIGHFRHGTVWLAFRAQRRGNTERAKQLLRNITHPERLTPQHQAYYRLLLGIHALEAGAHNDSYGELTRVEGERLRSDNDRSFKEALLAAAALGVGERERARRHVEQARAYPCRDEISAFIDKLASEVEDSEITE